MTACLLYRFLWESLCITQTLPTHHRTSPVCWFEALNSGLVVCLTGYIYFKSMAFSTELISAVQTWAVLMPFSVNSSPDPALWKLFLHHLKHMFQVWVTYSAEPCVTEQNHLVGYSACFRAAHRFWWFHHQEQCSGIKLWAAFSCVCSSHGPVAALLKHICFCSLSLSLHWDSSQGISCAETQDSPVWVCRAWAASAAGLGALLKKSWRCWKPCDLDLLWS